MMKNPKNFSMYGFTVLALVLSTLGLVPQIRADGFHSHGAQNFEHQNFDETSFRASLFKSSDVDVSNNEKDKKENGNSNSGPNLGNDDGDDRKIDTDPAPVTTPEPAVYALLFAGLAGLFGFAALKKVKA
jgi:hypothetical protein